jgi:hypothetical protein
MPFDGRSCFKNSKPLYLTKSNNRERNESLLTVMSTSSPPSFSNVGRVCLYPFDLSTSRIILETCVVVLRAGEWLERAIRTTRNQ